MTMMLAAKLALTIIFTLVPWVCAQPTPVVTPMDYDDEGYELQGYYSEPESFEGTLPAIIFIPDWDGVNLYEQQRATMVAQKLGWIGFAADIYGKDLHEVPDIQQRIELANMYRSDPALFAGRIQAAIDFVRSMGSVDSEKVAIVGFCFGGTGVIQYALQGVNNVTAIVSIHGGLSQVLNQPLDFDVTPPILVLSGGEDDASSDIKELEMTLDAVSATWEITRYSDIEHAWTVFGNDAYNEFADMRTWDSMVDWLYEVFGYAAYVSLEPDEAIVEAIDYVDVDGTELRGYLAIPDDTIWELPAPAVILIPDWDGVNEYEQKRATLLAEAGYVALAADIYGADLQTNLDFETRVEQANLYRNNKDLFVQRMARAVELLQEHKAVDSDNIAMFGYCFGGTGIIYYAFSGRDDIKVAASFHGGLTNLPEDIPAEIVPYVLILSGGADDAHGDQTVLENALNAGDAKWEISRWSGVDHGFTSWTSNAYNVRADIRSWVQTLTFMAEVMQVPSVTPQPTRLPLVEVVAQTFVLQTLEAYLGFGQVAGEITGTESETFALMAPWNAAFDELDPRLVGKLQSRPWMAHLKNLLHFHLYNGNLPVDGLLETQTITMANGEEVVVTRRPGTDRVRVNGILVIALYDATNGFSYMLESVLVPAWVGRTIADIPVSLGPISTFISLIAQSGFSTILSDVNRSVTVFAPSNDAFAALDAATLEFLQSEEGISSLYNIFQSHTAVECPYPSMYFTSRTLPTLGTSDIEMIHDSSTMVTEVRGATNMTTVISKDLLANNGLLHLIDSVLL